MRLPKLLASAVVAAASGLVAPLVAHAAPKHAFGVDDLAGLRSAHGIAIDPAGRHVLYVVNYFGPTGPEKQQVHEIGTAGDGDRVLPLPEQFTPAGFMADGSTLYGGYPLDGNQQLALVPLDGTKPMRLVVFPAGMHDPVISPDGRRLAMLRDPRPKDTLQHVRQVVENDQSRLYVLDADGSHGDWWCPDLNYVGEMAWSPDGRRLAVVSQMPKIGHHDVHDSIAVCDESGTKHVAELPAPISGIAWTDGGKTLAFTSTTTQVLTPDHVWTVPADGGTPRDRTPDLQGSVLSLVGDPQGTVWLELHKGVTVEADRFQDGKLLVARDPDAHPDTLPARHLVELGPDRPPHEQGDRLGRGSAPLADGDHLLGNGNLDAESVGEGDDRLGTPDPLGDHAGPTEGLRDRPPTTKGEPGTKVPTLVARAGRNEVTKAREP